MNLSEPFPSRLPASRGMILVITLWSLAILGVLAVYLAYGVRQKLILLERLEFKDKGHYLAAAGIKKAILKLKDSRVNVLVLRKAEPEEVLLSQEKKGYYYLRDEERKINVNTCGEEELQRLLSHLLGNEELALKLAYAIIDWRDEDSFYQHPQYGAEDSDYRHLNRPYEAKDSKYQVLEELLLVKGMKKEIFEQVKNYLTIYGEGRININTGCREVLLALGLSEELTEKILSFRRGGDLIAGTSDDNIFSQPSDIAEELKTIVYLTPAEVDQLKKLENQLTTTPNNFMIESWSILGKNKYPATAVVDRAGKILCCREQG